MCSRGRAAICCIAACFRCYLENSIACLPVSCRYFFASNRGLFGRVTSCVVDYLVASSYRTVWCGPYLHKQERRVETLTNRVISYLRKLAWETFSFVTMFLTWIFLVGQIPMAIAIWLWPNPMLYIYLGYFALVAFFFYWHSRLSEKPEEAPYQTNNSLVVDSRFVRRPDGYVTEDVIFVPEKRLENHE